MKTKLALLVLTAAASVLRLPAAVPLSWTVETSRAQPATFEAYQGETIDFEAALQAQGKPLEAPLNYSFFWQTNGMGSTYWEAPAGPVPASSLAGASTNVLFATWLPAYDVGARVYNCFIGSPSNIYHAAFQLRLRPSPGATPNALPLPQPVIDFAKVRVLNPPWSGGGGGGVDTNAVVDIIHATVDGAARPLPKYLHLYEADDSYPAEAAEYYRSRGDGKTDGGCSSVRSGGYLYRNFDFPFDDRAEFIVKMSAGTVPSASSPTGAGTSHRFASVGVAQVGTNLTEQMVTSGKPEFSARYKALPGATVDGINENGVACNINVVDGDPQTSGWHNDTGDLHPLAAVRWALDNAATAIDAATNLAARIAFPSGWAQNFHYMIADETSTYIVENGDVYIVGPGAFSPIITNFQVSQASSWDGGPGMERYDILHGGANITNVWFTNAYRRKTNPPWVSDLRDVLAYTNDIYNAWASHPKEYFRGKTTNGQPWWQSVHTSIYDLTNRVLRVAVQEVDDWYTFAVPSAGGTDEAKVREIASEVVAPVASSVSSLQSSKADRPVNFDPSHAGNLAALDESGDLADSGIAPDGLVSVDFQTTRNFLTYFDEYGAYVPVGAYQIVYFGDNPSIDNVSDALDAKADRSMISATDETFSNEVATVARTVTPPPSPTLRLYDEVRGCWWLGKMVNGVMQWEVE